MNGLELKKELIQEVENRLPQELKKVQGMEDLAFFNGSMQEAIQWGVELADEIVQVLEDKKVSFSEAIGFTNNGVDLIPIIRGIKDIPNDWEYLKNNDEYMNAILIGVEQKLSMPSDKVRKVVKQAIIAGVEVGKLINYIAEKE